MSQLTTTTFSEVDWDNSTTAAALEVFQIPELCEMILFYLKPRDRLHAKIAHKSFSQTIMGSTCTRLRKSLFLEADKRTRERILWLDLNSFRLNPFLRSELAHRGWNFKLDTHHQNSVRLKLFALSENEQASVWKSAPYPTAAIKDMLVSQPPMTVLLDFETKPHVYVHHEAVEVTGKHCTIGWILCRAEEAEKVEVVGEHTTELDREVFGDEDSEEEL